MKPAYSVSQKATGNDWLQTGAEGGQSDVFATTNRRPAAGGQSVLCEQTSIAVADTSDPSLGACFSVLSPARDGHLRGTGERGGPAPPRALAARRLLTEPVPHASNRLHESPGGPKLVA